jgi:hypothetical protein
MTLFACRVKGQAVMVPDVREHGESVMLGFDEGAPLTQHWHIKENKRAVDWWTHLIFLDQ